MDIFSILQLLSGLALFLYGMNTMGDGLEKFSGGKLEKTLEKMTNNTFKGFLLGAAVTAVIQSSSATTVMVVGFVNSGIMKLRQAIGIIMGANVGTTVTAWILSLSGIEGDSVFMQLLKPTSFSAVFAFIGIILIMFTKSDSKKNLASILLGFAVLMFGMDSMSSAVAPLSDDPNFANLLTVFNNPVFGIIAGALLTAIIQSSSASVGILQALSKSCNSTFAQIAIELGPQKLADTAKELGLTSPVSLNNDIQSSTGRFFLEKSDADDYVGWTGIGQGDTLVSPIAMLRLAGAIANDGTAVSLNLVESFATKAGKALDLGFTTKETPLLSSDVAGKMKKLLRNNVKTQYGDYNYEGLHLCAKSGTAQIDNVDSHNTAWFVGFMDDEEHPYAFVVLVEYGNSGSQTAGPIANKVLQALVNK